MDESSPTMLTCNEYDCKSTFESDKSYRNHVNNYHQLKYDISFQGDKGTTQHTMDGSYSDSFYIIRTDIYKPGKKAWHSGVPILQGFIQNAVRDKDAFGKEKRGVYQTSRRCRYF